MENNESFRALALSFPESEESPHWEKTSFRINKKIFATLDEKEQKACIKLSETDQSVFSSMDKGNVYAVPNKWGKQGWTFIELDHVDPDLLKDALTMAYCEVAPKRLSEQYKK